MIGPDTIGPDTIGSDAIGPDAMGPDTVGPDTTGTASAVVVIGSTPPRRAVSHRVTLVATVPLSAPTRATGRGARRSRSSLPSCPPAGEGYELAGGEPTGAVDEGGREVSQLVEPAQPAHWHHGLDPRPALRVL